MCVCSGSDNHFHYFLKVRTKLATVLFVVISLEGFLFCLFPKALPAGLRWAVPSVELHPWGLSLRNATELSATAGGVFEQPVFENHRSDIKYCTISHRTMQQHMKTYEPSISCNLSVHHRTDA